MAGKNMEKKNSVYNSVHGLAPNFIQVHLAVKSTVQMLDNLKHKRKKFPLTCNTISKD